MSNMLKPVEVPSGVTVTIQGTHIKIKGPLGELERDVPAQLRLENNEKEHRLRVVRSSEDRLTRAMHGTYRTLLVNMIEGRSRAEERTA
jgi:large subunit ribosomal protein L6